MIRIIYIVILIYFILGGIGFYLINRKKEPDVARKSYTKFLSYFFIINILYFSIVVNPLVFRYVSIFIIGAGFIELLRIFYKSGYKNKGFYFFSAAVYSILSTGFFFFSGLEKEIILFSFLILSIFDSFSQITGQLWGNKIIFPSISPNKTVEGLIGGAFIAIISALLLWDLVLVSHLQAVILALSTIVFAFAGDIAASFYKRKYKVKDYNNLIPGHGGFLDRFDSLIAGGAWVALSIFLFNIATPSISFKNEHAVNIIVLSIAYFVAIVILLAFNEIIYRRFDIKGEITRKFAHFVSTLAVVPFPYIFPSHWHILVLAGIFFSVLLISQYSKQLKSIHDIERKSIGSYLLPLSIYSTFLISYLIENKFVYILPMLILAVCDPMAAILGINLKKYNGRIIFFGKKLNKSWLGSGAFLVTSFAISVIALFFHYEVFYLKTFWLALLIALTGTLAELISWRGSDNLTIPLSVVLILVLFL